MDGDINDRDNSHDPHEYKIRGAAARADARSVSKNHGNHDTCTICLEHISERAVAVPCNHLSFDFLCLVSWLQEQNTCPLCKGAITKVEYDFRGPHDYKTYHVPKPETTSASSRRHSGEQYRWRSLPPRRPRPLPRPAPTQLATGQDASLGLRRNVYRSRLYSLHVGANRVSHHRDFTVSDFASSTELQSRAKTFLRRELQVFTFLDRAPRGGNRDFLIEYIVAILKSHELRGADGKAEELLQDFLGLDNTRQLLHELEAWLRSPYMDLRAWDAHAQYRNRTDHGNKSV